MMLFYSMLFVTCSGLLLLPGKWYGTCQMVVGETGDDVVVYVGTWKAYMLCCSAGKPVVVFAVLFLPVADC